jgi:hypothetical protein
MEWNHDDEDLETPKMVNPRGSIPIGEPDRAAPPAGEPMPSAGEETEGEAVGPPRDAAQG